MKNVLIFDVETTGLNPAFDTIIEVGCVLWSVEHRSILETYSCLLPAPGNAAVIHNGIPPAALQSAGEPEIVWAVVEQVAQKADAVVAHNVPFDRGFVEALGIRCLLDLPWICTIEDVAWPTESKKGLVFIALAHGVGVCASHRAVEDCLLLARLFERVTDMGERLEVALVRSQRPKAHFVSLEPYERREQVKAEGFKWYPEVKQWRRYMAVEDARKLPFQVVRLADA